MPRAPRSLVRRLLSTPSSRSLSRFDLTSGSRTPHRLRRPHLRPAASRTNANRHVVCGVRSVLCALERNVPRQRRHRPSGRPATSDQVAPTDRARDCLATHGGHRKRRSGEHRTWRCLLVEPPVWVGRPDIRGRRGALQPTAQARGDSGRVHNRGRLCATRGSWRRRRGRAY